MLFDRDGDRRLSWFEVRVAVVISHDKPATGVQIKAMDMSVGLNEVRGCRARKRGDGQNRASSISACEVDALERGEGESNMITPTQGLAGPSEADKGSIGEVGFAEVRVRQVGRAEIGVCKVLATELTAGKIVRT